ncbi:uncharacterized protein TNCV_3332581 [Trichonephila clavipes]|nr:uncharacterized protein TNCV_3332581 [Trichonephila clavipes]
MNEDHCKKKIFLPKPGFGGPDLQDLCVPLPGENFRRKPGSTQGCRAIEEEYHLCALHPYLLPPQFSTLCDILYKKKSTGENTLEIENVSYEEDITENQKKIFCVWTKNTYSEVIRETPPKITDEILTTARDLELEVNEHDIEELIMGHEDELTIEEHQETQRNVSPSEQEEDERGQMPTSAIKNIFKKWDAVRAMVLEWLPYQADVSRVGDLYNDNAINYFRKILKKREKQSTLDMFFNAP